MFDQFYEPEYQSQNLSDGSTAIVGGSYTQPNFEPNQIVATDSNRYLITTTNIPLDTIDDLTVTNTFELAPGAIMLVDSQPFLGLDGLNLEFGDISSGLRGVKIYSYGLAMLQLSGVGMTVAGTVSASEYFIGASSVLSSTTLGSGIISSSLRSLGVQTQSLNMGGNSIISCSSIGVGSLTLSGLGLSGTTSGETFVQATTTLTNSPGLWLRGSSEGVDGHFLNIYPTSTVGKAGTRLWAQTEPGVYTAALQVLANDSSVRIGSELYVGPSSGSGTIRLGGGASGDDNYNLSVIESRLYSGTEQTEMVLFKGNDGFNGSGPDRIRLRAGAIVLDCYSGDSVDRTAENILVELTPTALTSYCDIDMTGSDILDVNSIDLSSANAILWGGANAISFDANYITLAKPWKSPSGTLGGHCFCHTLYLTGPFTAGNPIPSNMSFTRAGQVIDFSVQADANVAALTSIRFRIYDTSDLLVGELGSVNIPPGDSYTDFLNASSQNTVDRGYYIQLDHVAGSSINAMTVSVFFRYD